MDISATRADVIEEVNLVPDDKVDELLDVVHGFRLACHGKKWNSIMRFAGSWSTLPDAEFQGFLDEVADRRAHAFSRRPRQ